jgi:hypothetical protein
VDDNTLGLEYSFHQCCDPVHSLHCIHSTEFKEFLEQHSNSALYIQVPIQPRTGGGVGVSFSHNILSKVKR